MGYRHLFINDGTSWFIRQVSCINHDLRKDEKIYRCDEHLGGPFQTLQKAIRHTDSWYDWFVRWDADYLRVEEDGRQQIMKRVSRAEATPFERMLAYVNRSLLIGTFKPKSMPRLKVVKVLKRGRPWLNR